MERTTQPYWQSLQLIRKRLQQRKLTLFMEFEESAVLPGEYESPKKDGYDYVCGRVQPVKIKRTYYRDGKRIAREKDREIAVYRLLKADVRGERAIVRTVVLKESCQAISMAVMPAGRNS